MVPLAGLAALASEDHCGAAVLGEGEAGGAAMRVWGVRVREGAPMGVWGMRAGAAAAVGVWGVWEMSAGAAMVVRWWSAGAGWTGWSGAGWTGWCTLDRSWSAGGPPVRWCSAGAGCTQNDWDCHYQGCIGHAYSLWCSETSAWLTHATIEQPWFSFQPHTGVLKCSAKMHQEDVDSQRLV